MQPSRYVVLNRSEVKKLLLEAHARPQLARTMLKGVNPKGYRIGMKVKMVGNPNVFGTVIAAPVNYVGSIRVLKQGRKSPLEWHPSFWEPKGI